MCAKLVFCFIFFAHSFSIKIDLAKKCKYEERWEHQYNISHPLSEFQVMQTDGYLFRLPLLVYAEKDVHILLSETPIVDIEKQPAYEIGKFFLLKKLAE